MNRKNHLRFLSTFLISIAFLPLGAQTMIQNWLTKSNNAAITNSDDRPYFTHVDGNGMIGIVGVSNNKVILSTYDANGNDLWTNKLESYSSDSPLGLEKGPNGNYYVGYYWSGNVRKMGLSGGSSWTTASSSYHGADFVVDANGDVYMVGTDYARSIIYIDKILANGTKIWTKTYTGFYGFGGQPKHVKMDYSGNLLIAMDATNSTSDRYMSVVKFDTVGSNPSQVWHNVYSTNVGEVYDFRLDNTTNACYVSGKVYNGGNFYDMAIFKSGPSGAINWSNTYHNATINSDDVGYSLDQDPSGNVYVASRSAMGGNNEYTVKKYSSAGASLATAVIPYTGYLWNDQPKIAIHPGNNQIYLSGTSEAISGDQQLTLYRSNLGLTGFSAIYSYNHTAQPYDFGVDIDIDPSSQNVIFTGNIFSTVNGNDYYYAKTDTLGSLIYSGIYNGVINGSDYATSLIIDASNLPLVAGGTKSTLTGLDGFMVKYDAVGNEQWQSVFTGTGGFNDYLAAVDINTSGHYYAGGFTETGSGNPDMWIIKVDGNGSKMWDLALQGTNVGGKDAVTDIYTDNFNNGYAAGYQNNSGTGQDATIIKFNSSGSILWNKKYTGSGNQKDAYRDIGSKTGNLVYAAGYTTKPNGESDMLLAKYDNQGNLQWSRTFNSPNNGNDTALAVNVDANQDVAIVGSGDSTKVMTAKYDANGNILWSALEPYVTEIGPDVITFPNGPTLVTCHFDSSSSYSDRVICYDKTGMKLWQRNYSFGCCEHPMKMAKTSRGTVMVAIDFMGLIGAIELDTLGNELNNVVTALSIPYGDPQYGGTRDVKIDSNGDVYVAGFFADETGSDVVTQKLCYTPAPLVISGPANVCAQSQGNLYGVTSNTTVTNYAWLGTSGLSVTTGSVVNAASVNVANTSGYLMLQQTNYCGVSQPDSLFITVWALPTVSAGADQLVCPNTSITLSGSGAQNYSWSSGVVDGVAFTPVMSQAYFLSGTDTNGCSNGDTVVIALKLPPAVNLCMVTVDTFSTHNILVWEKAGLTNEIAYFNIYREDITNNYTLIGSVAFDSLSEYHDYDTLMADPNVTTKRYKIAAVDTCGNEGPKSSFHNTIFISHSSGTFNWNTYTIQNQPNPVNNYALYRDDFANGNWTLVGTTAGTQNVLNDPNYSTFQATADWRVETVWNISCTATARQSNGIQGAIVKSKSNISNNRVTGIKNFSQANFSVYPNPTNGSLNVVVNGSSNGKTNVKVFSMMGQELYNADINGTSTHNIDLSSFENGTYLLQVTSNSKTSVQRIVKQ